MSKNRTETQRLLVLSAIVDLLLGVAKVLVGLVSHSYALVTDGIHSLSDLATDIMVWIFNRIGTQAPDEDHPYGHARFETIGSLILGFVLIGVAIMIIYDTATKLMEGEPEIPHWPALLVAGASIGVKEWLFQITMRLGKKQHSKLIQANAWHHRSDSLSSIVVFIGIAFALFGYAWVELVAAAVVAIFIIMIGWELIKQSVSELVDTSLSESYIEEIRSQVNDVEGVKGVHSIRTRRMGADALVDIHLEVSSTISVSEGHHIGAWVSRRLQETFPEINDVIVHIDPEDDAEAEVQAGDELPVLGRGARKELEAAWVDLLDPEDIHKVIFHYLDNQIETELFLKSALKQDSGLKQKLQEAAKPIPWFSKLKIWFD